MVCCYSLYKKTVIYPIETFKITNGFEGCPNFKKNKFYGSLYPPCKQ